MLISTSGQWSKIISFYGNLFCYFRTTRYIERMKSVILAGWTWQGAKCSVSVCLYFLLWVYYAPVGVFHVMSHKVLPVFYFMLIITSDLPLASWLNDIVSCDCHMSVRDIALLFLVIPFMFVVLYPRCQGLFCSDKQEMHFFLAIKK